MVWKVKAILDSVAIVLIAFGEQLATTKPVEGHLIAAVGIAIKVASEYLYEKGVIVKAKGK